MKEQIQHHIGGKVMDFVTNTNVIVECDKKECTESAVAAYSRFFAEMTNKNEKENTNA